MTSGGVTHRRSVAIEGRVIVALLDRLLLPRISCLRRNGRGGRSRGGSRS